MTFAFNRSQRLRHKTAFQHVFAQAQKRYSRYLYYYVCHNHLPHGRIAIMINRKQVKHAVKRNQIRRIVRESYRQHQAQLVGVDIIISVKKAVLGLNKQALRLWLDTQWLSLMVWYKRASSH